MKFAVLHGPEDLRMEERPIPDITEDEVLIKVKAAGICGSDVHFYRGKHPYSNYPRIHGHELSGRASAVGQKVINLSTGDPVVIEPLVYCGDCYPCMIGKYNCCENLKVIGAHLDGGFSEYLKIPAHLAHQIPSGMAFDIAATCEPYTIGHHAIKRAVVSSGDCVLILGAGAIGLTATYFCRLAGAAVYVADISPFRQKLAKKIGASLVIDPATENIAERVGELTGGEGVSVVIEATGVPAVMESAEDLAAAGGRIVIAGLTSDRISFTGINFTRREMTIMGTRNSAYEFPSVIDIISSGKTLAGQLITKKFPFSDMPDAMEFVSENSASEGKVMIEYE